MEELEEEERFRGKKGVFAGTEERERRIIGEWQLAKTKSAWNIKRRKIKRRKEEKRENEKKKEKKTMK